MKAITNQDDVIDSRDIIKRIEELTDIEERDESEEEELNILNKIAEECEGCGDWEYGEQLINEDYFVEYIEQLIDDCYDLPKELNSGAWPYRHMTIDFEAAAEEAKQDYVEIDFDGQTFFIRA